MELLSPPRALPALPHVRPSFTDSAPNLSLLLPPISTSVKSLTSRNNPGWRRRYGIRPLREVSTVVSEQLETAPDEGVLTSKEEEQASVEGAPLEASAPAEEFPVVGEQSEAVDLLSKLNLKAVSEDTYAILVYGTAALVALWVSVAIAGEIDSIPVFPKVMEVVGLAFTVWFSYRYLIFKENRDELFAKLKDLKEQIIGLTND